MVESKWGKGISSYVGARALPPSYDEQRTRGGWRGGCSKAYGRNLEMFSPGNYPTILVNRQSFIILFQAQLMIFQSLFVHILRSTNGICLFVGIMPSHTAIAFVERFHHEKRVTALKLFFYMVMFTR